MTGNFISVLVVLFLGGGERTDLVSFLPPRDYFRSRKIELSLDKMVELASRAPSDPTAQIQQLLALRVLAEDADDLKEWPPYQQYRRALEEIAQGKKAQDPTGFAKEYAARVLARLDGAPEPPGAAAGALEEGLAWFPDDADFVAMLRVQRPAPPGAAPEAGSLYRRLLWREDKEALFNEAEQLGNVVVDRITLAVCHGKDKDVFQKVRFFVRVSGRFNQAWVRKAFQGQGLEFKERPGAKDGPVAEWRSRGDAIVLVENTDLLFFALDSDEQDQSAAVVDAVLARREGKAGGAVFRDRLKVISPDARGFLVGEARNKDNQLKIQAELLQSDKGLICRADATVSTESDAEGVEKQVKDFLVMFKENLPNLFLSAALGRALATKDGPAGPDKLQSATPDVDVKAITASLDEIKIEAKGNKLQVRAVIPETTWVPVLWVFQHQVLPSFPHDGPELPGDPLAPPKKPPAPAADPPHGHG